MNPQTQSNCEGGLPSVGYQTRSSRLSQSNLIIILLNNFVTFAGGLFEFGAAQNLQIATHVLNNLLVLQNASRQAYRGPVRPQHRRKEVVGDSQRRGIHSVLSDE